jgi:hypothetical protein
LDPLNNIYPSAAIMQPTAALKAADRRLDLMLLNPLFS